MKLKITLMTEWLSSKREVRKPSLLPFLGLFICLMLVATTISNVKADDLPVIQKSGTLTGNETWEAGNVYMITGVLSIPNGITLTIEEGTIVKFQGPNWLNTSITVASGGTLYVNGTLSDPVVFTSFRDDSAGGDSNGGGASSGARNDYQLALKVSGGTATVSHGIFRYSQTSFSATNSATATIADSEFSESYYGVFLSGTATTATLQRNQFALNGGTRAIGAQGVNDVTGIVLSGTDKNTFTGNLQDTMVREYTLTACRLRTALKRSANG